MPPPHDTTEHFQAFLEELRCAAEHPEALRDSKSLRSLRDAMRRVLQRDDPLRQVMDSQDLAQDGMLLLIRGISQFRGQSWGELIAFAKVNCSHAKIDAWRRMNADKRTPPGAASNAAPEELDARTATPSVIVGGAEQVRRIEAAIDRLPDTYRESLRLRLGGADYAEISKKLDISIEAARQRVTRAVQHLGERLQPDSES